MAQFIGVDNPEAATELMTKALSDDMDDSSRSKRLISDTVATGLSENIEDKRRSLYFGPEEKALVENFSAMVNSVELGDVLELAPDRAKPPKSMDKYRLVPLNIEYGQYTNSAMAAAMRIEDVAGVRFNYNGDNRPPWLDTSYAIGLVYDGTLSAVAGAHTTKEGHLRISQLQCVAPPPDPKKGIDKYSSGLHAGFLWRPTLVRAWIQLAEELGISTVEILGAVNNPYSNRSENLERFLIGYDKVAEDMGFTKNEDGNWELSIAHLADRFRLIGQTALDKQAA